MGNDNCVASGANPHSMGFVLRNESSKMFRLSNKRCGEANCKIDHHGFRALTGKFKEGYVPPETVNGGSMTKCWMSGREASAKCPSGWIEYETSCGGTLRVEYNSAGWSDAQNRAFVEANLSNCPDLSVRVAEKNIVDVMGKDFRGTDSHRQFEIIVEPRNSGESKSRGTAGLRAENRVLPVLAAVGIGVAGFVVAGPVGAVLAGTTGGKAVANVMKDISGPEDMHGNELVEVLSSVPEFPTFLSRKALQNALDQDKGGKVITGGPCAGVAIQRAWWLLANDISAESIWRRPKAPCIASDVCDWLQQDGFHTEDLGTNWAKVCSALQQGKVVSCIIRNLHWVTVIGVKDGLVYVINYPGLYRVPELEFKEHVQNVALFAPTAAISAWR